MASSGYIYILVNPALQKNLLKIGMTSRSPEDRASELSTVTGLPSSFVVAYEEIVPDIELAEKLMHQRLHKYRTNVRREFFSLPLKNAIEIVNQVSKTVRDQHQEELSGAGLLATRDKIKGNKLIIQQELDIEKMATDEMVRALMSKGDKATAIKYLRMTEGLSRRAAKKYIDDL